MPWFRFIEECKHEIRFRDGVCRLTLAILNNPNPASAGPADVWAWVAERVDDPARRIILLVRGNMLAVRIALMNEGFAVEAGSAAEKVMLAAVRLGHAEELPDDPHWRMELIMARNQAKPKPVTVRCER